MIPDLEITCMSEQENVFVAMPISTPKALISTYRDDEDHFLHVYEHLFVPAIKETGRVALTPQATGADLIHAEIVRNLSEASLVLCDMSTLNPNVFFEMGIRCALNRPMCFVIDEVTSSPPFDMGIINFFEYNSEMRLWSIAKEITALASHIEASIQKAKGENAIWRYFGLKTAAQELISDTDSEGKLELLQMEVEALHRRFDSHNEFKAEKHTGNKERLWFGDISDTTFTSSTVADLQKFKTQMSGRLRRARTRDEELEIEHYIQLIEKELENRDQISG